MFIDENKILEGTLRRSISSHDNADQTLAAITTAYSLAHHHYFILNLFVGGAITLGVTLFLGLAPLSLEALWCYFAIGLSLLLAGASVFFVRNQLFFRPRYVAVFFWLIAISSLLALSSVFALVVWRYGLFSTPVTLQQTGVIFFYITTTQLFYVLAPTHLKFCIFLAVGSLLPALAELVSNPSLFTIYQPIYIYILAYAVFVVISTITLRHIRLKSALGFIDRHHLTSRLQQHKALLEIANQQMVDQKKQRLNAEHSLKQASINLEHTIEARTRTLSEKNAELVRASQNLNLIQNAAKIVMWEWDPLDNQFSSTSNGQITGYSDAEILALRGYDKIILKDDRPRYIFAVSEYIKKGLGQEALEISYRVIHKQGHEVHLKAMMLLTPRINSKSDVPIAIGIIRDITEEKLTKDRMLLSNSVFEHSAEGIFLLDEKLNYLLVNPRFGEIMGLQPKDMISLPFLSHLHPSDQEAADHFMHQLDEHQQFKERLLFNHSNQKPLTLEFSIAGFQSRTEQKQRYAGTVTDVTELVNHQHRVSYLSNYDLLTDLPNRKLFKERLEQITMNPKESTFALIRINIDRFSVINNSLGQATGDQLLKLCSERISRSVSDDAELTRLAADDFCLVQQVSRPEGFDVFLENLHHCFIPAFKIDDQELNIRASMGVSFYPKDARQIDKLIGQAEQALKSAKKAGGNTYRVFSSDPQISGLRRLTLENELRRAVSLGELVVFYQPKVDLISFKLTGLEALIRWQHPEYGLMQPGVFLPIALESDLIIDIGNEVMTQVCQQIRAWEDILPPSLKISVNVDAQQFKSDDFMERLIQAIESHQINPKHLEVEITESSLMDTSGHLINHLKAIQGKGISIALDDFGTGYSSLSYLNQFPIDVLKIDRSFIEQIGSSKQSDALVKAILAMGKALDLDVVAEGVETAEQVEFLKKLGCLTAQGYFFGKPMSAQQFEVIFANINTSLTPAV